MVSRFEQRFRQFAVPKLDREFAVCVTLIFNDDSELPVKAFVEMNPFPPDGIGFSELEGRLTVKTSLFCREMAGLIPLQLVRINDEVYDVYTQDRPHAGLITFNIRRKFDEQQHSNLFDLHGDQIPYAE